jgi:hypothetical protein
VDQTHKRCCKRRRDATAEAAELGCAVAQRRERAPSQGRGVWGVALCWGASVEVETVSLRVRGRQEGAADAARDQGAKTLIRSGS